MHQPEHRTHREIDGEDANAGEQHIRTLEVRKKWFSGPENGLDSTVYSVQGFGLTAAQLKRA
jgi:hypothetical protein